MCASPKLYSLIMATLFITAIAHADDHNVYVQFNSGAAFPDDYTDSGRSCDDFFGCSSFRYKEESDPGYVAGAAIGYRFNEWFRLEGEAMFQSNDLNKSTLNVNTQIFGRFTETNSLQGERERTTFLINGYYDFKNSTVLTPYLTGGIGGYYLRINADRGRQSGENDLDFAWQLGAGINYQLNERISLDLKYRFLGGTEADVVIPRGLIRGNRLEQHDVGDHQVLVGIRLGL